MIVTSAGLNGKGVPGLFELLDGLCDYLRFMEIVDSIKTFRQEHRMYVSLPLRSTTTLGV